MGGCDGVMVLGCENIGGCDMVQNEHFYTTLLCSNFNTRHQLTNTLNDHLTNSFTNPTLQAQCYSSCFGIQSISQWRNG
jgi:hypothetical protein